MKNYKLHISGIFFFLFIIVSLVLSMPAMAQFTASQNQYLNKNELLLNPGSEQGVTGWTSGAGVVSSVTTDYFAGARSFQISLTAQTMSFCQSADTSIIMQNASLIPRCQIKTTNPNIQICNRVNGVNQDCAGVSNTGDWVSAKPSDFFTAGSATSGVCIISTVAITDTVLIDNCSLSQNNAPIIDLETDVIGVLPTVNGGTNVSSSGPIGNVLTSDGTNWISQNLPDFIYSINSLVTGQQFLVTGTSGTDFNISSATATHTFNLPVASAVNTGKLDNDDWTTFNNKVAGPNSSVDGEIALFDLTTGKLIKRATGTGVVHATSGVYSTSSVVLTSEVSGILPVANGGTGASSLAANNVLLGDGTNPLQVVAPGASGNVLTSNGTTWISSPVSGGTVTIFNGDDLTLTAGDTIAVTSDEIQRWRVQGGAGAITLSTTPFGIVPPPDGTEITIIGNDNTNTVEFTNNDIAGGCILNGNAILQKYFLITFIYNQTLDRYIEVSRSF